MKSKHLILFIAASALLAGQLEAAPIGTAFTYQGRLNDAGQPANGSYDLKFTLYGDPYSGSGIVAGPITNSPVLLSDGLFTVRLDFGNVIGHVGADRGRAVSDGHAE